MGEPEERYAEMAELPCPKCGGRDFTVTETSIVASVSVLMDEPGDPPTYHSRAYLEGPDYPDTNVTCDGCGFKAGDDPKGSKMLTLRVPEDAWNLLSETLHMDASSGSFDEDLRGEIRAALDRVRVA
jgi:hypothetical protein